jgi:hypothetical protein
MYLLRTMLWCASGFRPVTDCCKKTMSLRFLLVKGKDFLVCGNQLYVIVDI